MISRLLRDPIQRATRSVLLLGPRQTGKSTLIDSLRPDLAINLARESTFLEFTRNPAALEERLAAKKGASACRTIFIDEVQRLPSLLNTVQALLDERPRVYKFYLTGSSARKLRRGQANLLPGRLLTYSLGPIVAAEADYALDTRSVLSTGTLPGILTEPDVAVRRKVLRSYAGTYLREEVQAESLARNLEGFSRFLAVAAEWAGTFLDYSKMASAASVARQSAVRFFEILEDCLIVHRAPAFAKSAHRRLVQHPRFYFFDPGVLNGLLGNFTASADRIGPLFEHLIFTQLLHGAAARDEDIRISSFRTEQGAEVDFIVELSSQLCAIEVKASTNIGGHDLRGLKRFAAFYGKRHRAFLFYLGDHARRLDSVEVLPWQQGLKELGF